MLGRISLRKQKIGGTALTFLSRLNSSLLMPMKLKAGSLRNRMFSCQRIMDEMKRRPKSFLPSIRFVRFPNSFPAEHEDIVSLKPFSMYCCRP